MCLTRTFFNQKRGLHWIGKFSLITFSILTNSSNKLIIKQFCNIFHKSFTVFLNKNQIVGERSLVDFSAWQFSILNSLFAWHNSGNYFFPNFPHIIIVQLKQSEQRFPRSLLGFWFKVDCWASCAKGVKFNEMESSHFRKMQYFFQHSQ